MLSKQTETKNQTPTQRVWCRLQRFVSSFFCWHKYEDIQTQITKNISFGYGSGMPGYRVIQKCKKCGYINYQKLNLMMPDEYLYQERIWKNC